MKNVLLFAASSNPESINGKLINYTAGLFKKHKTNVLRLYDYPLPVHSPVTDWLSRIDKDYSNLLSGKTILLISTSPSPRSILKTKRNEK